MQQAIRASEEKKESRSKQSCIIHRNQAAKNKQKNHFEETGGWAALVNAQEHAEGCGKSEALGGHC